MTLPCLQLFELLRAAHKSSSFSKGLKNACLLQTRTHILFSDEDFRDFLKDQFFLYFGVKIKISEFNKMRLFWMFFRRCDGL